VRGSTAAAPAPAWRPGLQTFKVGGLCLLLIACLCLLSTTCLLCCRLQQH
jgi:hypothetical protein